MNKVDRFAFLNFDLIFKSVNGRVKRVNEGSSNVVYLPDLCSIDAILKLNNIV